MPSRPGAVVSIAQPSRNRDKLLSVFTNPESALMSASPFEIKDYRQPLVTSLGVILGFLLGFLGQWVTEDNFAIKTLSDAIVFYGCLLAAVLLLVALYRMLKPAIDASDALKDYRTTLTIYLTGVTLAFGCIVVSGFV